MTLVRIAAALSTCRSSQNGYTAAFGAPVVGMGAFVASALPGLTKLTTPFVSIHAVLYSCPYSLMGNGRLTCPTRSSPVIGCTVSALTNGRGSVRQLYPKESAQVPAGAAV